MIRGTLNGYWIVIRGQLGGHNDTPFGRPTPGGFFSYYQLVILFLNREFTTGRDVSKSLDTNLISEGDTEASDG
jgi:hypothetical protein